MRKFLALAALILIPGVMVMAQDAPEKVSPSATPPPIVKSSRDFLMIDLLYNSWLNKPDTVKIKGFGYAFNAYLCYDFPIKRSRLSFATGLGIAAQVVYLDHQYLANTDTGVAGAQARFLPETTSYKRYKFATTYLQAPFELRYFGNKNNRNKGFKAAIGLEIGTLLGAHTKATTSFGGTNTKLKVDTKRYVSTWNFAATARVGFGNFSLFGSYNLTNVFKENFGPQVTPYSIGLCLTGL